MKILQLLFVTLFLSVSFTTQAQQEVQLPSPYSTSSSFFDSYGENTIFYGQSPANSAGNAVLVFVHGFTSSASTWFDSGNTMYQSAYNADYRTAFVSMTEGEGMWVNGGLLANMLVDITQHYDVNKVVIIAHSNGGKASEVAMFYHNKKNLVDRAITLGTPFHGTELADLAETFWFAWLADLVGLGGGTATSTTYYMGGSVRPYMDNLSTNRPGKFINFGAEGNCSGTTLSAPAMCTAGGYIHMAGGGKNDGVTPYYSSSRPGGFTYWSYYNSPDHDHTDVKQDYVVWNDVEPLIGINMNNLRVAQAATNNFPKREIISNFQIINAGDEPMDFVIEEGATDIQIELMYTKEDASFELQTIDNQAVTANSNLVEGDKYQKGKTATLMVEDLQAGRYNLKSDAVQCAAIVSYNGGVALRHVSELSEEKPAYSSNETVHFNVEVLNMQTPEAVDMKAFVTLKNDLQGNPIADATPVEISFELQADGSYEFTLEQPEVGVYNVFVEAKGETFARNLITGFVVNDATSAPIQNEIETEMPSELSVNPNLIHTSTMVTFEMGEGANNMLSLFDVNGQLVRTINLDGYGSGVQQIELNLDNLESGVYFLNLYNDNGTQTQRVVKF